MKNIVKLFGIIALVAVIGFTFAACGTFFERGGGTMSAIVPQTAVPRRAIVPQTAVAQNVTFNGYWETPDPDGTIVLIKERIFLFVQLDGNFWGGSGGFAANARQFTLQRPGRNTINTHTFDYTVIDSTSIRVTDTSGGHEWLNGIWRKRTNIPGTRINHRLIGYWEGRDGDRTRILYFAGNDIVPRLFTDEREIYSISRDGWVYEFDRENNLVAISDLFFNESEIFLTFPPGWDGMPQSHRFDGSDVLILGGVRRSNPSGGWEDNWSTETRFVRK